VWTRLWNVPSLEVHDVLGSTNDRARELAAKGAAPFTVVIAERQSAGRGRSGSGWHSPAGRGLWMSTLLPLDGGVPTHLPLLVGLAAARAVEAVCPGIDIGLKWPNDVQVGGRKAGGVLCEHSDGVVVAGIGLNVRQRRGEFPEELAEVAISLETALGGVVSRGRLAGTLLARLVEACAVPTPRLSDGGLSELARRDVLRDRRVTTQQAGEGVARGIDVDGALVLERPDGARVRVVAGSVRIT
jgi:BirA family biotin operon repressor/biotin-[acetyl-CoA-carboxylase] ligase